MQLQKAYEISDARIQFVSLVDRAANCRQFLITKAEDGKAQFSTVGRIVKMDGDTHFLTGVVYEPLVEDAHGNFMTEEEITKAAHWFAKDGDKVDVQHSFEEAEGVSVVESYIAPCDMEIDGVPITKGTWLMTVEVNNADIWSAVQKGEITGFSMGGFGKYSEEDIDLGAVTKNAEDVTEKKGLLKRLAGLLGLDTVEKGQMMDSYKKSEKYSGFWNAFQTLENLFYRYDRFTDKYVLESDESIIREALEDFSKIIVDLLTEQSIVKSLMGSHPILKSGKKISSANKKKLDEAYSILTDLYDQFNEDEADEEEETEVTKAEMQEMIEATVNSSIKKALEAAGVGADTESTVENTETPAGATEEQQAEAPLTRDDVTAAVEDAVAKMLAPIFKARGIANNLNDEQKPVEKSQQHYLDGIL